MTSVREVQVGWGHCDPAGIVFYPNFYHWFDEASHALMDSLGIGHRTLADRFGIIGCGLIDTGATFRAPARDGDVLRFESSISELTSRTFRVEHRVSCGEVLVCSGHEVRGCFVADAAKPGSLAAIPIPDEMRRAFSE
ncbi:MAG: thioesterase family protein [Pseudomonadota bacterium]